MSGKQTYRVCFCFQRRFRLAAAEAPADVRAVFVAYSGANGFMSVDQLRRFLVEVQKEEKATVEDAQALIDSVSLLHLHELKHLTLFHNRGLNIEGFFKYLFGDANPPLNPKLGVINFSAF